jgi:hypothetical protein
MKEIFLAFFESDFIVAGKNKKGNVANNLGGGLVCDYGH